MLPSQGNLPYPPARSLRVSRKPVCVVREHLRLPAVVMTRSPGRAAAARNLTTLTKMIKRLGWIFAGLGALSVLIYLTTLFLVKPVSMDLSLVGQGKPSLVLAYENFSPTGGAALEQIRKVRGDYAARLVFIVADLGTPQGRRFAIRHGLADGQAVLLDPQGTPLSALTIPQDSQALRARLDKALSQG